MDFTALELDGYGNGNGDGNGYGNGDGNGDGNGYGNGNSDGNGNGNGYGNGYGYGNGNGKGYGNGDGNGDGKGYGNGNSDGYGDGNGYGDEKSAATYYTAILSPHQRGPNTFCFWRSERDGKPANGGSGGGAFVGKTEEIGGPLELCTRHALHGTLAPHKWKGERLWVVELHQPVATDTDKLGSLKRTIIADLGYCNL